MRDGLWLRSMVLCEDVRFELGGTLTLVGVFGETVVVAPGEGEIVLPRLVTYCAIAGLLEVDELIWRQTLVLEGTEAGPPLAARTEKHDPQFDEHRLINYMTPFSVPRPGRCRLAIELETHRTRRLIDYHFSIERAERAR